MYKRQARRYASAGIAVDVCLSVSVCLSHAGIVSKLSVRILVAIISELDLSSSFAPVNPPSCRSLFGELVDHSTCVVSASTAANVCVSRRRYLIVAGRVVVNVCDRLTGNLLLGSRRE